MVGGYSLKVTAPRASVTKTTELKLSVLPAEPGEEAAVFKPFRLNLADESQPTAPVEIVLELPEEVKLGQRIELKSWPDSEFDKPSSVRASGTIVGDVYLSLQDRRTIAVETQHFTTFKFETKGAEIDLDFEAPFEKKQYSRKYDDEDENKMVTFKRGGMDYFLPAGFSRVAIDIGKFDPWEKCVVGFHGTTLERAKKLLEAGAFMLPKDRKARDGEGVRSSHIREGTKKFGVENWPEAIFLSPSHKYTMAPSYGQCGTLKQVDEQALPFVNTRCVDKDNNVLFCCVQCRIKPDGLTRNDQYPKGVFPGTTGKYDKCDGRVSSEEMEYHVKDPKDIQPYGILLRTMKLSDLDAFFLNGNHL